MPIYEYKCQQCDHQFEVLVKSRDVRSVCPACKGKELEKLVSSSGFILKGGGWYKDGYSKGSE